MKNEINKTFEEIRMKAARVRKVACVLVVIFLQGSPLVFGGVADGILESSFTPGWRIGHVENPVSLSDFHSALAGETNEGGYAPLAQTSGLSDSTNGISVEVRELARSLFHDSELIVRMPPPRIGKPSSMPWAA